MKKSKKLIMLCLIILPALPMHSVAAESWWKKAINVVSGSDQIQTARELSGGEIADAFKQALTIGSEEVVSRLGSADGFNADPSVHIPLPNELNRVKTMLATVGLSYLVDDLELRLNRAAELATPVAKELFLQAISDMTFDDVMEIYQGPEDSATSYFQAQMSQSLSTKMRPIISESLSQAGAIKAFDSVIGRYEELPFVPDVKANITDHVVNKGMEGIFFYLAKEEAAIRENPAKQTTDLLRKVFGTN